MFVYGWSVLELKFGLLVLSFYPMRSFVLRVEVDTVEILPVSSGGGWGGGGGGSSLELIKFSQMFPSQFGPVARGSSEDCW